MIFKKKESKFFEMYNVIIRDIKTNDTCLYCRVNNECFLLGDISDVGINILIFQLDKL